jgi:hypothetical protein
VIFSLSKPFGAYYDRIGGVWCREQDLGLFGNMWFKSLMALQLGTALMQRNDVFALPRKYAAVQAQQARHVSEKFGVTFEPADVYMLATAHATANIDPRLAEYLRRPASDPAARLRICLTPGMAEAIGTAGPVRGIVLHTAASFERGGPLMKNSELLVTRADVHDYVGSLWKTDAFRTSHKTGGFIYSVIDQFAMLPRLFCETTNDRLERAHFSTWWGAIMHRPDYTNQVIVDLYCLHEIYHAAKMPYVPDIGRAAFDGDAKTSLKRALLPKSRFISKCRVCARPRSRIPYMRIAF